MLKGLIVLLFLLNALLCWGQDGMTDKSAEVKGSIQQIQDKEKVYYDSLLTVLEADNSNDKIGLIFEILEACPIQDNDKYMPIAEKLIQAALDTASSDKSKWTLKHQLANLHMFQAAYYLFLGKEDIAMEHYDSELTIRKAIKDREKIADTYLRIARHYDFKSDFKNKLNTLKNATETFKEWDYLLGLSKMYYQLSLFYANMDDIDNANHNLGLARQVEIRIGDTARITRALYVIGVFHLENGSIDSARSYFKECEERAAQLKDFSNLIQAKYRLGTILFQDGLIDSAIAVQLVVYNMSSEYREYEFFYRSSIELAKYYRKQGKHDQAKVIYERILQLLQNFNLNLPIAETKKEMAEFYYEQNLISEAKAYMDESLRDILEFGDASSQLEALKTAYQIDSAALEFESAFAKFQQYNVMLSAVKNKDLILQEAKESYQKDLLFEQEKSRNAQLLKDAEISKQELEIKSKQKTTTMLTVGLSILGVLMLFLIYLFKKKAEAKKMIEEQKLQVDAAFEQLEEKNTEIMDSINYAKRIQSAILPPAKLVKQYLNKSFILYKPKDIVAGDFYWMHCLPANSELTDDGVIFAAADCTGHGVPGAMVSVVCNNGLNRSVREFGLTDPGQILDKTREIVISEFRAGRQAGEKSEEDVKDGMDIALVSLHPSSSGGKTLKYAGAHNPLWIIRNGATEIEEIKADKQPIGKYDEPKPYTTHTIELQEGDSIYIFSDGFVDQFGGPRGKKYKSANFKKLLLSVQHESMDKQQDLIDKAFEQWREDGGQALEQLDDVCVIGVRI